MGQVSVGYVGHESSVCGYMGHGSSVSGLYRPWVKCVDIWVMGQVLVC